MLPGPPQTRRWPAVLVAAIGVVVCGLLAVAAWGASQVTYALPNDMHGHDTLGGGVLAAVVAGLAAVGCLVVLVVAARARPLRTWVVISVVVACVLISALTLVLFEAAPQPSY